MGLYFFRLEPKVFALVFSGEAGGVGVGEADGVCAKHGEANARKRPIIRLSFINLENKKFIKAEYIKIRVIGTARDGDRIV